MDVERLPSGKFESNKLVLELTVIAYNILRIIGQESLKNGMTQNGRKYAGVGSARSSATSCSLQVI